MSFCSLANCLSTILFSLGEIRLELDEAETGLILTATLGALKSVRRFTLAWAASLFLSLSVLLTRIERRTLLTFIF